MSKENFYTNGVAAFVNLTETEKYQGQDTGRYSVVLTLEAEDAEELNERGIKTKEYKGTSQRKFASKYPVKVVDADGEAMSASELTWGSKVRVKWSAGNPHPVHGVAPYLNAIKVLELNDVSSADDEF